MKSAVRTSYRIRRIAADDIALLEPVRGLFDHRVRRRFARRFFSTPNHHLLVAEAEGAIVGFISGVETTHPDKGTEMFVYELAVKRAFRRLGIASALVAALERLARRRGCYGMWVGAEPRNAAAVKLYRKAGGKKTTAAILTWTFQKPRR